MSLSISRVLALDWQDFLFIIGCSAVFFRFQLYYFIRWIFCWPCCEWPNRWGFPVAPGCFWQSWWL